MNNPVMFSQDMIMQHFNLQPSDVKGRANAGVEFYKRLLYTKLYSCLEFTLPESWKKNYFRFLLFHLGSVGVVYTKEYGWICQPYSIVKLDLYYNPKVIEIYNQYIKTPKIGVVGVNAGIIKCMDDFFGLDDVVTRYATDLAQCDRSIEVNLMNSNVTAFFKATDKKNADAIREAYGQATTGKPFVIVNKEVMGDEAIDTLLPNIRNNFIAGDLLQVRRGIMNAFLTEIGIRNANIDKKERLNSMEVNANDDETSAIIDVIYKNIKEGMEEVNAVSGLSLDVKLHYDYQIDIPEEVNYGTFNA